MSMNFRLIDWAAQLTYEFDLFPAVDAGLILGLPLNVWLSWMISMICSQMLPLRATIWHSSCISNIG